MDKELIWYRTEIERRFGLSEMRFYKIHRVELKPTKNENNINVSSHHVNKNQPKNLQSRQEENIRLEEEQRQQHDQFIDEILNKYSAEDGGKASQNERSRSRSKGK